MFNFDDPNPSRGYRFDATFEDLYILKHPEYNSYDNTVPEICCAKCHSAVGYDFDSVDPPMSAFYCMSCDIVLIKDSELKNANLKEVARKFFWSIPLEEEEVFVLKQVTLGAATHTVCAPMDEEDEKRYYFKLLSNYRSKFK